jgi:carboxymethylenebutenolidase
MPIAGASVERRRLTLTAGDGTEFMAFEARGSVPDGPSVLVLPDVRGLHPFYEELAVRFAERGIDAMAIDYFGRTAGTSPRPDGFEFMPHVEQMTGEGLEIDCRAAVAHLRSGRGQRPVFTVGFCLGGSNSWHQAANGLDLAGAIGFYGHPGRERPRGAPPVVDRVGNMTCPILALMAGADPGIPSDEVDRFREALRAAGIVHEVVVYEGAPHSFFDRKQEDFAEESEDAWNRVLGFIGTHG